MNTTAAERQRTWNREHMRRVRQQSSALAHAMRRARSLSAQTCNCDECLLWLSRLLRLVRALHKELSVELSRKASVASC